MTEKIRCLSRVGSPACPGYVFRPGSEIVAPILHMLVEAVGDVPVTRRAYIQRTRDRDEPPSDEGASDADEDHWRFVPLGPTFAERWQGMEIGDVGEDLVHADITVRCHPQGRGGHSLEIPEDFSERVAKFLR